LPIKKYPEEQDKQKLADKQVAQPVAQAVHTGAVSLKNPCLHIRKHILAPASK